MLEEGTLVYVNSFSLSKGSMFSLLWLVLHDSYILSSFGLPSPFVGVVNIHLLLWFHVNDLCKKKIVLFSYLERHVDLVSLNFLFEFRGACMVKCTKKVLWYTKTILVSVKNLKVVAKCCLHWIFFSRLPQLLC